MRSSVSTFGALTCSFFRRTPARVLRVSEALLERTDCRRLLTRAASAPDSKDRHVAASGDGSLVGEVGASRARHSASSADSSHWPIFKASMVMGVGSQIHAVESAPTIWKHVVETQAGGGAGGGGLMAECFKTMQKYQTRCQRLELQLQNMQRSMREAQKERSAQSNGTVSPVDTETSSPAMPKTSRPKEPKGRLRSDFTIKTGDDTVDLSSANKRIMELEEDLDKEKERRFKSSARLKSSQIALKAMQVIAHFSQCLTTCHAASF
jgi:hypothetical protein